MFHIKMHQQVQRRVRHQLQPRYKTQTAVALIQTFDHERTCDLIYDPEGGRLCTNTSRKRIVVPSYSTEKDRSADTGCALRPCKIAPLT
jgi:hypothetical protein